MEGQKWVYVPSSVRWVVIAFLVGGALLGLGIAFYYVHLRSTGQLEPNRENWILVGMALAQICLSTLAIVAVALFSQRVTPLRILKKRSEAFLRKTLKEAVHDMRVPIDGGTLLDLNAQIEEIEKTAITTNSATFNVWLPKRKDSFSQLTTHIYLNLDKTSVYFYIPLKDGLNEEKVMKGFEYESKHAKSFGFLADKHIGKDEIVGGPCFVFAFYRRFKPDFFDYPDRQWAFAQDYARLIRSFFMSAKRAEIELAFIPSRQGKA